MRGRAFALNQSIQFLAVPVVAFAAWKLGPLTIAGIEGWRWVVLLGAAAAIGVWFIQVRLPESPRWLAEHGRLAEADAILSRLETAIESEKGPLPPPAEVPPPPDTHTRLVEIFGPALLPRTLLLVVLNAFQAVGFYGFTNWAPTFLAARGVHFAESLQYGFIIAAAYPIGPLIWSTVAERFERKWLVVAAAAGTGLLGLAFAAQSAPAALIALGVAINFSNNLLSLLLPRLPGRALPDPGARHRGRLRLLLEPALDGRLQLRDRLAARASAAPPPPSASSPPPCWSWSCQSACFGPRPAACRWRRSRGDRRCASANFREAEPCF